MGNGFDDGPLLRLLGPKPGGPPKPPAAPHYLGHRDRLRKRFREGGADALPDYELMELILFRAIPRRDVKPLAKAIIARFGCFAEAVAAPPRQLAEIKGLSDAAITEIKLVRAASLRAAQGEAKKRPLFGSMNSVLSYLRAAMAFEKREQFRILFLDRRNRLIADEVQAQGSVDHAPVYVREVVKRALDLSATAIILTHNHPSGDPTPSQVDIDLTRKIVEAGRQLGVVVHDHIIVGRDGHASLKALKLI